jgi:hypothetical protein
MAAIPGRKKSIDSLSIRMGIPSAEQLRRINAYRTTGRQPFTADEVLTLSIMVSNNFIHSDEVAWSLATLLSMKRSYPGRALTINHSKDARLKQGRVYDSHFTQDPDPPQYVIDGLGLGELNRMVLERDGALVGLWLDIYVLNDEAGRQIYEDIRDGKQAPVSTQGNFYDEVERCHACNCNDPRGVWGSECPYLAANFPWWWFYSDEELEEMEFALWSELDGRHESMEISLVWEGALPAARVPTEAENAGRIQYEFVDPITADSEPLEFEPSIA